MAFFFPIFFSTFVLEDLALASGIVLVSEQKMSFMTAFAACFLGIGLGDIGLYVIGYAASRFDIEKRFRFLKKYKSSMHRVRNSKFLTYSIFISRAIPGTRLPTYLSAGYLHYSFFRFVWLTALSVSLWVAGALWAGESLQSIFMDHWFLGLLSFFILLKTFQFFIPRLLDPWRRKALLHAWRKYLSFEFWPGPLFYIPIIPYYIFLSFKYRSPFMPFYANPNLAHGGLIGESKWDFLRHLNPNGNSTLPTLRLGAALDFLAVREILDRGNVSYPFIMKPDVGQRGFAVRILRNDFDLTEYLLLSQFDRIVQRLSALPQEAGLFYIRKPSQEKGYIFSVTDKAFPFVVGDGRTRLGDLILQDKRARIIAETYFSRLQEKLNSIPAKEEKVPLSECGNHCQGAIFFNGHELITEALTEKIDQIAQEIPDFYFGRFDVRYQDAENLKAGRGFEIVEVNGAGSEATHIWDARTKLLDAYSTLFTQWDLLFSIGAEVQSLPQKKRKLKFGAFLKECAKVFFRKESLSVSS